MLPWQRGWDGAELPEDGTNSVPFAAVLSPGGAAEPCRGGVKADSEKCAACNLGSVIEPSYLISWPWLLSVGGSGSGFCITNRISAHVRVGMEVEQRLKGFFCLFCSMHGTFALFSSKCSLLQTFWLAARRCSGKLRESPGLTTFPHL